MLRQGTIWCLNSNFYLHQPDNNLWLEIKILKTLNLIKIRREKMQESQLRKVKLKESNRMPRTSRERRQRRCWTSKSFKDVEINLDLKRSNLSLLKSKSTIWINKLRMKRNTWEQNFSTFFRKEED